MEYPPSHQLAWNLTFEVLVWTMFLSKGPGPCQVPCSLVGEQPLPKYGVQVNMKTTHKPQVAVFVSNQGNSFWGCPFDHHTLRFWVTLGAPRPLWYSPPGTGCRTALPERTRWGINGFVGAHQPKTETEGHQPHPPHPPKKKTKNGIPMGTNQKIQ